MTRAGLRGTLLVSALVAVGAVLALPPAPAQAAPVLTVTPSGEVRGGDPIEVTVTGMPPSTSLAIGICQVGRAATGPGDCADSTIGASTLVLSDGAGSASAVLTVVEGPAGNSAPPEYRCGPGDPCEVRVSTIGAVLEQVVRQPLVYAGAPTATADPGATADTDDAAADGIPDAGQSVQDRENLSETAAGTVILVVVAALLILQIAVAVALRVVRSSPRRGA